LHQLLLAPKQKVHIPHFRFFNSANAFPVALSNISKKTVSLGAVWHRFFKKRSEELYDFEGARTHAPSLFRYNVEISG
jgi:hypothetical protein